MSGPIAFAHPRAGRNLVIGLFALVLALDALFVLTLAIHRFGPDISEIKLMFDLGRERNVPTRANTMLLLLVAGMMFVLAGLSRAGDRPGGRSFAIAGAAVACLSIDEAAQVHELAGEPTAEVLERWGIEVQTYAWVIPGTVVAAVLVVAAWRWARTLPTAVRRRLGLAVALYGAGAFGVETINGWLVRKDAEYPFVLGTMVEETLEMSACIVAATGLAKLYDVSNGSLRRRDTHSSSSGHGVRRQGGPTAAGT